MNTPSHESFPTNDSIASPNSLGPEDLYPLIECRHSDPHHILGVRPGPQGGSIARVYYPGAVSVSLLFDQGEKLHLIKVHADGVFEASSPQQLPSGADAYQIEISFADGSALLTRDSYAFAPQLSEFDLYLLGQGEHLESYKVLGAHLKTVDGMEGTAFAVWAPNAQRVSVVGDFNEWDGRRHMMRRLGGSGIWEIFVPGVEEGDHYKYELRGLHGEIILKTDPYAFYA